jgi:hypothetical protein
MGSQTAADQDEPDAEDISGRQRARLGDAAKFDLLAIAEHDGIAVHTRSDVCRPSNVYSATGASIRAD